MTLIFFWTVQLAVLLRLNKYNINFVYLYDEKFYLTIFIYPLIFYEIIF